MRRVDGPRQRLDQPRGHRDRLGRPGHPLGQAVALYQLEHQVRRAGLLPDAVDLHEVGMLEPGHRLGLDPETGQDGRAGLGTVVHHLDRDRPVQVLLPRPVHHPHAAAAQHTQDRVASDLQESLGLDARLDWPAVKLGRDALGPTGRRLRLSSQRLVQLELELQLLGILGEPQEVLRQRRPLAHLFTEQILGEDQVEGLFPVVPKGRNGVQVGLDPDPLPQPEPLRLVNPQDGEDLLGVASAGGRQEVGDVGLLPLAPQAR